jgi:hypothetical protein
MPLTSPIQGRVKNMPLKSDTSRVYGHLKHMRVKSEISPVWNTCPYTSRVFKGMRSICTSRGSRRPAAWSCSRGSADAAPLPAHLQHEGSIKALLRLYEGSIKSRKCRWRSAAGNVCSRMNEKDEKNEKENEKMGSHKYCVIWFIVSNILKHIYPVYDQPGRKCVM